MINPIVSVIIPCRNEKEYIENCIRSIFNQIDLLDKIEVIVVDGESDDGTQEILENLSNVYPNLKVINNPNKVTPNALNLGIKESGGEYVCIFGAHAEYADDFLIKSIELMNEHPEADCVGGPIISKGLSNFGKSVSLAMSSTIGVGNAKHRFPKYEGYAEMACFPVFRNQVFNKIGIYDETLVKNQDDEFCFRLTQSGGKVFISPKVKSIYYVRETVGSLFNQYFNYGKWRIAVLKKHKIPISFRQIIPTLFYLSVIILLVIGMIINKFVLAVILPVVYLISLVIYSSSVLLKHGIYVGCYFLIAVIILHLSYAIGFIAGIFSFKLFYEKTKL